MTPSEQITFGNLLETLLLNYDPLVVHGDEIAVGRVHTKRSASMALRDILSSPGARAWWEQSRARKRWPPHLVNEIEKVLEFATRKTK